MSKKEKVIGIGTRVVIGGFTAKEESTNEVRRGTFDYINKRGECVSSSIFENANSFLKNTIYQISKETNVSPFDGKPRDKFKSSCGLLF